MNVSAHGLVLLVLFGTLTASSFPIKGPEMYQSRAHTDLEELVKQFLDEVGDESNFKREKKLESESEPLFDHRRKTDPKEPSCQSHMSLFESNRMIDTKKSLKNGAEFLGVDKIEPDSEFSLKDLQSSCVQMCCSSDSCDTAILSLIHGQNGYRCYMFKCSQHCLFIKHKDYVLLRQKSPEEEADGKNIQTGHKNTADLNCHKDYEFTCLNNKQCIPIYDVCDSIPHCDDKSDELYCGSNSTSSPSPVKTTTRPAVDLYDYDQDYEQDLIRQQNEIIEHLSQLEAQHSNRFYHSKNFLEKFMKEEKSSRKARFTTRRSTTRSSTFKHFFHDMGAESMKGMDGSWNLNSERHVNFGTEDHTPAGKSDSVQAVVILVIGCLLVASFFVYLAVSTKYLSKKLRIMNLLQNGREKSNAQNVDVDGDYLINGLYL